MISKELDPFVVYPGDNAAFYFGIPFPTFEVESLKVYVELLIDGTETLLVENTDFTVANLGVNGVEGSLTLVDNGQDWHSGVGLDVQYALHIEFDSKAFQPGSFRSLGNYSPITLENTLDRLTMSVKAVGARVDELDDAQTVANTEDIASLNADVVSININIDALEVRVLDIENELASRKDDILDNVNGIALETIDSSIYEHMVLEYIVKRDGAVQYGRQLLVGQAFTISPLEKVGNCGVSFSVTNSAGIGTLEYTSSSTGIAGEIQYRLYKFTL